MGNHQESRTALSSELGARPDGGIGSMGMLTITVRNILTSRVSDPRALSEEGGPVISRNEGDFRVKDRSSNHSPKPREEVKELCWAPGLSFLKTTLDH